MGNIFRTSGKYGVIMNETHFKELLFESIPPPPTLSNQSTTRSSTTAADLMQMGFPTKLSNPIPSLCACHSKLQSSGFICPRCGCKLCDVPADCVICGLTVVSSPHLARSYRHLFPVANWKEVSIRSVLHPSPQNLHHLCNSFGSSQCSTEMFFFGGKYRSDNEGDSRRPTPVSSCFGCAKTLTSSHHPSQTPQYVCGRCAHVFCSDCDVFHEQLGLCPGCCT